MAAAAAPPGPRQRLRKHALGCARGEARPVEAGDATTCWWTTSRASSATASSSTSCRTCSASSTASARPSRRRRRACTCSAATTSRASTCACARTRRRSSSSVERAAPHLLLRRGHRDPRPRDRGPRHPARRRDRDHGPLRAPLSAVVGSAGPGGALHLAGGVPRRERAASLTASDYGDRDKYISLVREIKQTPLSLHWENLLKPMVPAYLGGGTLQYYQIENKRIPIMTLPRLRRAARSSRAATSRASASRPSGGRRTRCRSRREIPRATSRTSYCYDRFWDGDEPASGMNTRYTICGPAFAMITKHGDAVPRPGAELPPPVLPDRRAGELPQGRAAQPVQPLLDRRSSGCAWATTTACASSRQRVRETARALPALQPPLLVPRDLQPGARGRHLQALVAASSAATSSTTTCARSRATSTSTSTPTARAAPRTTRSASPWCRRAAWWARSRPASSA